MHTFPSPPNALLHSSYLVKSFSFQVSAVGKGIYKQTKIQGILFFPEASLAKAGIQEVSDLFRAHQTELSTSKEGQSTPWCQCGGVDLQ